MSETQSASTVAQAPSCAHCAAETSPAPKGSPSVALVGAQNSGKSTLFNALTGSKVRTGNWPGTSIEVSRGAWALSDGVYDLIDFPGTYSLDPMSPDEALTRDLLLNVPFEERPDVVVATVDAMALGRSLYMVTQLAEHGFHLLVALTKCDLAEKHGTEINAAQLEKELGFPVIPVDGRHRTGLAEIEAAVRAALIGPTTSWPEKDIEERFEIIDRLVSAAASEHEIEPGLTEKIDAVALHPVGGPIVFLAAMFAVFHITITLAAPLQDWAEGVITGPVADGARWLLEQVGLDHPLVTGLLVDGIIGGVGMVVSFLPLMGLMFLCLAILEDSGYMARAAVVTDRTMRAIGLPGKAFIPIVVGFGCNVPAISATRVLGSPRQRILTSLLIPFASCSARLVVFLMLATIFFPAHASLAVFTMYVVSILLITLTGLILRHTLWRTMPDEPLIIDLPEYQLPTVRLAATVTWTRLKGFLHDAATVIVATVTVVWLLMAIPVNGTTELNPPPEESAYGAVAQAVAPVFEPAGFGSWTLSGPLITGFVAKEAVISTWAQMYAVEDVTDEAPDQQAESSLAANVRADFEQSSGGHPLAAVWAFMLFMLAYTPCVATLAAQRREIGWKWTMFGFGVQLVFAWLLAVGAFNLLKVFGL